jgi:hypothetical protein
MAFPKILAYYISPIESDGREDFRQSYTDSIDLILTSLSPLGITSREEIDYNNMLNLYLVHRQCVVASVHERRTVLAETGSEEVEVVGLLKIFVDGILRCCNDDPRQVINVMNDIVVPLAGNFHFHGEEELESVGESEEVPEFPAAVAHAIAHAVFENAS